MQFLETLLDEDLNLILIPIDNIYTILCGNFVTGRKIIINLKDGIEYIEKFDTPEAMEQRYDYIKKVIGAA